MNKKFLSTKFFRLLREASQKGTDNIRNRVKGDRTTFPDKLKQALTAKMERLDEKPSRKQALCFGYLSYLCNHYDDR
jgi:hypothetical protein